MASCFPLHHRFPGRAGHWRWWSGWAGQAVLGEQAITPGVLVAFVLYIDRFFEPIRDLSQRYDSFQSTMAGGERIFGLLDTPVEVQDAPARRRAARHPRRGALRAGLLPLPGRSDPGAGGDQPARPAWRDRGAGGQDRGGQIDPGQAGQPLPRPRLQGCVPIDGYDLRQVTQQCLRRQMGIVLQDPFLFTGTVAENIRFGRLEASDAEVEAAAQAVGAHEFITHLRQGYDTPVEEGGVMLSVGQRQLISFARALLADPRILILDEATSSVDTQTERMIQQALTRLLQGRTAFVIAHRLSTVVNADRIVVIQDGRIVEEGTHVDLLARGGVYYELYRMGFED